MEKLAEKVNNTYISHTLFTTENKKQPRCLTIGERLSKP